MTAQVRKTIQNTQQFFYAFTVETPHQVIPIRAPGTLLQLPVELCCMAIRSNARRIPLLLPGLSAHLDDN